MGKKLKKIKINKVWKSIFSNKPLVIFVAVLILASVFTNKNISQYFKPIGSEAASGWTVTNITPGMSGVEKVQDVSGRKMVFTRQSVSNPYSYASIWLYDFQDKTTILVANLSKAGYGDIRMDGNKIVWWQLSATPPSNDLYVYDIISKQKKAVASGIRPGNVWLLDIWSNKIIYSEMINNGLQQEFKMIDLGNNKTYYLATGNGGDIHDGKFDANRVVWTQKKPSDENKDDLWLFDFSQGKATKITADVFPHIPYFDVYGDKIIAGAYTPAVGNNLFVYNIISKAISQVTFSPFPGTSGYPAIWKDKVAYQYNWNNPSISREIHFLDLQNMNNEFVSQLPIYQGGVTTNQPFITSFGIGTKAYIAWAAQTSVYQGDIFVATK